MGSLTLQREKLQNELIIALAYNDAWVKSWKNDTEFRPDSVLSTSPRSYHVGWRSNLQPLTKTAVKSTYEERIGLQTDVVQPT